MSYRLSCHCGAVEMDVTLSEGLDTARRCDCSYCRRRGAIAVSAAVDGGVTILKGEDNLSLYQWGTGTAKHYFCKTCGIYTHHQRRSDPTQYGINVACLEGINPRDLGDIAWVDGVNHPSDRA
ncbi:GFA family protein [Cognatishimia activa]|uniref:GFA family protein n=1 Tax=Cognatishimia activa TaxID=1715691 RepID=UPI002232471C|nr:GFA family protein [Cognatishimia activa]UZD91728.1 GFA family protein [Cognatishimia activa]